MFKVLIVDDEIYVVALIQKLISWGKYQMEIAATANDGVAALSLVKEIVPDLVIVDVRMPGYDGLTFMNEVRKFNTNVKFIVISGHKQFDYAREALRSNVVDYLLKPINKEELECAVRRVYEQLAETQQRENSLKEISIQLDAGRKQAQKIFFEHVLKGDISFPCELFSINEQYLTHFRPGIFQMCALVLDASANTSDSGKTVPLLLMEARTVLFSALQELCMETLEYTYKNISFFFLNYTVEKQESLLPVLKKHLENCERSTKKFAGLSFHICLGSLCNEPLSFSDAASSLIKCLLSRTALWNKKLLTPSELHAAPELLNTIIDYRKEALSNALASLNESEIRRCIKDMYSRAYYVLEEDSLLYYRLYVKLLEKIYLYFHDIGVCNESETAFKERMLKLYISASSPQEYAASLSTETARMVAENQLSADSRSTPPIRIVKRYIAEHYSEDISLSDAAKIVNLSPVYLSRLFKKEEGINFLDYLNQYRIDISKNLLKDVKHNILETASLSGFGSTKYFSKIFKKTVGITPSEYRKRHLGTNGGEK